MRLRYLVAGFAAFLLCGFGIPGPQGSSAAFAGGDVTNALGLPDGTAADPALYFTSDDDGSGTGFYRVAANTLGLTTNGSFRQAWSTTGTTFYVPATTRSLIVQDTYSIQGGSGSNVYLYGSDDATDPYWTIDGDGSATTAAKLAVSGIAPMTSGQTLVLYDEGGDAALTVGTTGTVTLTPSGTSSMSVNSSRVGVGVELALGSATSPGFVTTADDATGITLTESSATTISTVNMGGADNMWAGLVQVNVYAADATDKQVTTTLLHVTVKNDGGTITGTCTEINEQTEETAGGSTLAVTYTVADGGSNLARIQANAVSSLTQTTLTGWAHVVSGGEQSMGANPSVSIP